MYLQSSTYGQEGHLEGTTTAKAKATKGRGVRFAKRSQGTPVES